MAELHIALKTGNEEDVVIFDLSETEQSVMDYLIQQFLDKRELEYENFSYDFGTVVSITAEQLGIEKKEMEPNPNLVLVKNMEKEDKNEKNNIFQIDHD